MEFKIEKEDGVGRFRIKGPMTIYEASIIHDELKTSPGKEEGLSLDMEGVTDFDLAGYQLIYSASKSAESAGGSFCIENVPASVAEIADRSGLDLRRFIKSEREKDDVQMYHDGG